MLPAIAWQDTNVTTTELLARLYDTIEVRIRQNYSDNERRFEEGKHFFRLAGKELREFKANRVAISDSVTNSRTRELILWTERGAARHAKMLETDQAWDVFEALEDCYFHHRETDTTCDDEPSEVLVSSGALIK